MHSTAKSCQRRPQSDPHTHKTRPTGERLQPHAAVFDFDCTSCKKRCAPEPKQGTCARCIITMQARAGQVTTQLEPFLCIMLQSAVARVRELPVGGLTGYAAPVDRRMFNAIHRMLVSHLPVPGAGQGISMDRQGLPPQISGMQGGHAKYGFDVTLTEVVSALAAERSWLLRARTPLIPNGPVPDDRVVHWGPVFHMPQGAIGCIATPVSFEWEDMMPFHGVRAGRVRVKHDYFVLDVGGEWGGMGKTAKRSEEAAILNRMSLCRHANVLRGRGATFTQEQNSVIDMHLEALGDALPAVESDEEDAEDGGQDMLSPGRAARGGE